MLADPFTDALFKIERAEKHIEDFDRRLRIAAQHSPISLHVDAKTGKHYLFSAMGVRRIHVDLALTTGDAIHNLKCALDIAWSETLRRVSPAGHNPETKFPVRKNRQDLESVLTKTGKISPDSPLFRFMVDSVKSYEGGDSDIWAVHRLDIHDKHRLLIPALHITSINGVELKSKKGEIKTISITLSNPSEPMWYPIPKGTKLHKHGELSFEVKFGQGVLTENLPVSPALHRFAARVAEVVRELKALTA